MNAGGAGAGGFSFGAKPTGGNNAPTTGGGFGFGQANNNNQQKPMGTNNMFGGAMAQPNQQAKPMGGNNAGFGFGQTNTQPKANNMFGGAMTQPNQQAKPMGGMFGATNTASTTNNNQQKPAGGSFSDVYQKMTRHPDGKAALERLARVDWAYSGANGKKVGVSGEAYMSNFPFQFMFYDDLVDWIDGGWFYNCSCFVFILSFNGLFFGRIVLRPARWTMLTPCSFLVCVS